MSDVDCVDVLIPSKDRAIYLHRLLQTMSSHLKGIGRITITWQADNVSFADGYRLLEKRVRNDAVFSSLRSNSREIVFQQRKSLHEIYNVVQDSGESHYILPLVDDDVFIRSYELSCAEASQIFFKDKDVLCCSIRLGDNLSCQVSHTVGDGVFHDRSKGHAAALLSTGKPVFISPVIGHKISAKIIDSYNNQEHLIWNWVNSLNVVHWGCPVSTTSHIYRKNFYLEMFKKFGQENFLLIEGLAQEYLLKAMLGRLGFIYPVIKVADWMQTRLFHTIFKLHNTDIIKIIVYKLWSGKKWGNRSIPQKIVSPRQSVVVNLDTGTSHNRKIMVAQCAELNAEYLAGKIISVCKYETMNLFFPLHISDEIFLKNYNQCTL